MTLLDYLHKLYACSGPLCATKIARWPVFEITDYHDTERAQAWNSGGFQCRVKHCPMPNLSRPAPVLRGPWPKDCDPPRLGKGPRDPDGGCVCRSDLKLTRRLPRIIYWKRKMVIAHFDGLQTTSCGSETRTANNTSLLQRSDTKGHPAAS